MTISRDGTSSKDIGMEGKFPTKWEWAGIELIGNEVDSEAPYYTCSREILDGKTLSIRIEHQYYLDKPTFGNPTDVNIKIFDGIESGFNPPLFALGISRNSDELCNIKFIFSQNDHLLELDLPIVQGYIVGCGIDEAERPNRGNSFTTPTIYPPTLVEISNDDLENHEIVTITNENIVKVLSILGLPTQFRGGSPLVPKHDGSEILVADFQTMFKSIETFVSTLIKGSNNILPFAKLPSKT